MSGGLFTNQLLRETGAEISQERVELLQQSHAEAYARRAQTVCPLPGACELLSWLTDARIPWAIATSGRMQTARVGLDTLRVDPKRVPVITRDVVSLCQARP